MDKFEREAKLAPWSVVRKELCERVESAREQDGVICINSEPQGCLSLAHPNPLRCTMSLPITHGQLFLSQHSSKSGSNQYSLWTFNRTEDDASLERLDCRTDCTVLLCVPKHRVFVGFSPTMKLVVLSDMTRQLTQISSLAATRTILCLTYNKETDEVIAGGIGCLHRFGIAINHYKEELVKKPDFDVNISANDWITQLELYWRKRQLIVLSDAGIYFIAYRTNSLVHHLVNHHEVSMTKCCLHTPLDYIITGFKDGCIKVFTTVLYKGVHEFRGHTQPITGLQIHATEPVLISASMDHSIRLWSLETLELFCRLDVDHCIENLGLIRSSHLYYTTRQTIQIMSMNHFYSLFAMVESEVTLLNRSSCSGSSSQILASAVDGEIRILSPVDGSLLTMVYPMSSSKVWTQYVHNRFRDEIMAVLDCGKVLVLDSSTNPCKPKTVLESNEDTDDVVLSIAMLELGRCMELNEDQEDDCLVFVGQKNGQIMLTTASHYHMDWPIQAHVGAVISLTCSSRKKPYIREPTPPPTPTEDEEQEGPPIKDEIEQESNLNNNHDLTISTMNLQSNEANDPKKRSLTTPRTSEAAFMNQISKDPLQDYDHLISTGTDEFIKIWKIFLHSRHEYELVLICMAKVSCHVMPKHVRMVGRTVFLTCSNDYQLRAFRVWDEHNHDQLVHNADEDHTDAITGMDLNCDLGICVTTARDKFLKIWNSENILIREITFSHLPTAVCFANDRGDILIGLINHIFYFTVQNYLPVDFITKTELCDRHFDDDVRERCIPFDTNSKPTLETDKLYKSQVSHHKRLEQAKHIVDEELVLELLSLLGLSRQVDSVTGAVIAPWDLATRCTPCSPCSTVNSRPCTRDTPRIASIDEVPDTLPETVDSEPRDTAQDDQVQTENMENEPESDIEARTESPKLPWPPLALDGYIPNSVIRDMIGYRPPTPGKIIRKEKPKRDKMYPAPSHLFSMSGRDLLNPDNKPENTMVWEDAGERKSKINQVPEADLPPPETDIPPKRDRANSSFNEYTIKSNFTVDFSTAEIGYDKRANTRRQSTGGHTGSRPLRNYPRKPAIKDHIEEEQEQLNPDQVQGHINAFRARAMRDPDKLITEILRQKWYQGDKTKRDPIIVLQSLLDTLSNSCVRIRLKILTYIGMMQETFLFQPSVLHNIISHLKDELQHQEADVRVAAIELLIKMGLAPESIYIALIKNLVHENEQVRQAAEHALTVLTEIKNKDNLLEYFNKMGLLKEVATQPLDSRSIQNLTPDEDVAEVKEKESRMNNWTSKPNIVPEDLRRERDSLNLGAISTQFQGDGGRTNQKRGPIHIPGRSGSGIVSIADEMSWLEKKTPKSLFDIDSTRIRQRNMLRSSRSFRMAPPKRQTNREPSPENKRGRWNIPNYATNEEVELRRRRRVLVLLAETYAKRPREEETPDDESEFDTIVTPTSIIEKKKQPNLRAHFDVSSEDSGFPHTNTDTEGSAIAEPVKLPPIRNLSPTMEYTPPEEPEPIIEYYQPEPIVARPPEQIKQVDPKSINRHTKAMAHVREALAKFDTSEAKSKSIQRHRNIVPEEYEIREVQRIHKQNQFQQLPQHIQEMDPIQLFTSQFQNTPSHHSFHDTHDQRQHQFPDSSIRGEYLQTRESTQGKERSGHSLCQRRRADVTETETFLRDIKYGLRKNLHRSATEYFMKDPDKKVKVAPIQYGKGRANKVKCSSGTRLLKSIDCHNAKRPPPNSYWEIPLPAKQGVELVTQEQGQLQYGLFNMTWSSGKPQTPLSVNLRKQKPPMCPLSIPPLPPTPRRREPKVLPPIKDELAYEWDIKSLYHTNKTKATKTESHNVEEKLELLKLSYTEERKRLKEMREKQPQLEIIAPYTNANLTPSNSRTRFTSDVLREYMTVRT